MFITETWVDEARLDRTLGNINFNQKWVVPRTTRGGGLVLFWKNSVNLTVVDSHKYYINVIINKVVTTSGGSRASMVNSIHQKGMKLGQNLEV